MICFPRRLLESFLLPVLLSAFCMLARRASLLPSGIVAPAACLFIILIFNYINMNDFIFAIRNKKAFYKTNFAVFCVGLVFSVVLSFFDLGEAYYFLCLPYTLFKFLGFPPLISVLGVNLILAFEILIMPYIAFKRRR